MNIGTVRKDPGEVITRTIDFSAELTTGETITAINSVTATDALTGADFSSSVIGPTAPAIVGNSVQFQMQGGAIGQTLIVTVTVATSASNILQASLSLIVGQFIDLTTVQNVRAWANMPPSVPDALVQSLITAWSRAFMSMTRRGLDLIALQPVTEVRDGTGTDMMMLANFPNVNITGIVSIDNAPISVAPLNGIGFGYVLDAARGILTLRGHRFCRGRGNVIIPYTYGWPSTPEDVQQAANEMVLWLYRQRDHVDFQTQTLAQQVTSYRKEYPLDVCAVIERYSKRRQV